MKKLLFLIPLIMTAAATQAQECSKNHAVYTTAMTSPNTVRHLGSNPQFPFLRNLSTPQQVVAAMKSHNNAKRYPKQIKELNKILMEIGFSNGVNSVSADAVTPFTVTPGTMGIMGDGNFKYRYSRMEGGSHKGWKVASGEQCYITFLSACGNAFYPNGAENSKAYTGNKPKCENMPVNVTSDPKEITVEPVTVVKKKVYVYYKRGCPCKECAPGWNVAGYNEGILSRPLLVKTVKEPMPVTYKVTNNNSGNAVVCKGRTTEVTADIVVERQNEYTGYRPEVKKEYIEVTHGEYKKMLREKKRMNDVLDRPSMEECESCK